MKNKIYLLILFLACIAMACDTKEDDFNGPYLIVVTGSTGVTPETTETYQIGGYDNPEKYTWTVTGPAEIVGVSKGNKVEIKFNSVGKVTLTVTNGTDKGMAIVTVNEVEPDVAVTFNHSGALHDGLKDTVFLSFPAPLSAIPVITMLTSADSSKFGPGDFAFETGTLGSIEMIDASTYMVIYTAGPGNGTPEALLTGMKTTDAYGAVTVDSTYIQLYRVDNIAPLAILSYSTLKANTGTVVTVTATFTEEVIFKNPLDSALHISFAGGSVGAGKLKATDNPLVYTIDFDVTGMSSGVVTVTLSNIMDLAGNDPASITNTKDLTIDNTSPTVIGFATDQSNFVSLKITASETGTVHYLILESGQPAPADASALLNADGVLSGSAHADAATQVEISKLLNAGNYDVYFLSEDAVGNYSAIVNDSFTMN